MMNADNVASAPKSLWQTIFWIGPGLVTSACVIGSGELIAVPVLGAQVGFAALWLIILSCLVKAIIQEELGRITLAHGKTTLAILDMLPLPRWRVNVLVWLWFGMYLAVIFQLGGIISALAQGLHLLFPFSSTTTCAVVSTAIGIMLFVKWPSNWKFRGVGRYPFLEFTSVILLAGLVVTALVSVIFIQGSDMAVSSSEIVSGLVFDMPEGGWAIAIAAFGITGVGTVELIQYPYWVCKKGYQNKTGPYEESSEWTGRARGWIRVMQLDVVVSMLAYTTITLVFYGLGASILHRAGQVPAGISTVQILVDSIAHLGAVPAAIFLVCTVLALFSTYYVLTTHKINVLDDFITLLGSDGKCSNQVTSDGFYNQIAVALPLLFLGLAVVFEAPVFLVTIGAVAQTGFLLCITAAVIYHRYRTLPNELQPSRLVDAFLWISSVVIVSVTTYLIATRLG